MKKMLYIMRHGETLFNVRKKIQGACDSPLTENGKEQAKQVREILKSVDFDHYYSSTAERASDTLEIIIGDKPYQRLKGLKEMNFGTYEGESEDLNPRWENGYDDVFPKVGGESTNEVSKRLLDTCTEIMEKEDHQVVLAVSHAGACFHFARNFVTPEEFFKEGMFTNCSIVKLEYENGQFKFLEIIRLS
ncbi:MAG: histidine phosphatase family protein [Anaerorhabdus sp.]